MYALIQNGVLTKYPYYLADVKLAHPECSFPAVPDDASLEQFGAMRVFFATQPSFDADTQALHEGTPVFSEADGRWTQVWEIRALTAEELAANTAALVASITAATQQRLDDFAQTRNYDGILSACTYASSTIPKFAAEGQYCVDARDSTWATLYQIMADVQAGQWQMPSSFDDVEPLLPALAWPV